MTTSFTWIVVLFLASAYPHLSTSALAGGEGRKPRKTCAELGWKKHKKTAVCGSSKLPAKNGRLTCFPDVTFDAAEAKCNSIGARLCTQKELVVTQMSFRKGCSYAKKFAWTSNKCNNGAGRKVERTNQSPFSACKATTTKYQTKAPTLAAVCCSDTTVEGSGGEQGHQGAVGVSESYAVIDNFTNGKGVMSDFGYIEMPGTPACDESTWEFTKKTCGPCSGLVNFGKKLNKLLSSNTCDNFCKSQGGLVCTHTFENKAGTCIAKKSPLKCDTAISAKFSRDAICVCAVRTTSTTSSTLTTTTITTTITTTTTTTTTSSSTTTTTASSTTTTTSTSTSTSTSTTTISTTTTTATTTTKTTTTTTTATSTSTSLSSSSTRSSTLLSASQTNKANNASSTIPAATIESDADSATNATSTSTTSTSTTSTSTTSTTFTTSTATIPTTAATEMKTDSTTTTATAKAPALCTFRRNWDYRGADLMNGESRTLTYAACGELCLERFDCARFTWIGKNGKCYLKDFRAQLFKEKKSKSMWAGNCEEPPKPAKSVVAVVDGEDESESAEQGGPEIKSDQGTIKQTVPANILFAVADDLTHVSAYGHTFLKTPNFDKIANDGILFMQAHTPSSKCAPSRSTIITGRNPWQLGAAANNQPYFPEDYKSVVEVLGNNGYHVGYTGKGWGPGEISGSRTSLTGTEYNQKMQNPAHKPSSAVSPYDYTANFAAFLKKKPKNAPFFFWYGCKEPHRTYKKGTAASQGKLPDSVDFMPAFWTDNFKVRSDILEYAVEAEYFDKHLGQILAVLERTLPKAEVDNTMIIATSDNAMPFPHYKGSPYHHATLMPLAIKWKGQLVSPGRRSNALISFADFAPTFLAAAMIPQYNCGMQKIQGKSFIDVLSAGKVDAARSAQVDRILLTGRERNAVAHKDGQGYPSRSILQGKYSYIFNFRPDNWPEGSKDTNYGEISASPTKDAAQRMKLTSENYRVLFAKRPQEELFDIEADPESMNNLASNADFAEVRKRMNALLFAELKVQGDPRAMSGANPNIFEEYPRVGGLMCSKC